MEWPKVQLSSVIPNLGSPDTSCLHHATEVQPQWDHRCIPEGHWWGSLCHICPGPQDWPPASVPQTPRQLVTGRLCGPQWSWPFRADRPRWRWRLLPLPWSSKRSRNCQETERSRKTVSTAEIPLFDEIVNIPRQMRKQSLAKELSATIKEILGTAQSVGCNVDGRHPHDIIDDINSGAVECPTVSGFCISFICLKSGWKLDGN